MGMQRDARNELLGRPTIRVDLQSESGIATVIADVLDVSSGGAKLLLGKPLRIGTPLTLRFEELIPAVSGSVCWCRPDQNNRWWVACAFDPSLPPDVLELVLQAGYLERRRDPRENVSIPASARLQTGEQGVVDIRDFSAGGLCLTSSHEAQRGQRLLLQLGDVEEAQTKTMVEVQWCIQFNDGYLLGCSFLHREGLAAVRRLAAAPRSPADSAAVPAEGFRARLARFKSLWQGLAAWADRER
jgi:hypothetical protein